MKKIKTKSRVVMALTLAVIMAISAAPVYASGYTDIQGHWAEEYIDFIVRHDIIAGTSETTFSPDIPITRADFIVALAAAVGVSFGEAQDVGEPPAIESSFTDVDNDDPAVHAIEWGYDNKIISGKGDGIFDPEGKITREEMAAMMTRCATDLLGYGPIVEKELTFVDKESISGLAIESVMYCDEKGIMTGKPGNIFDPKGDVTRAETSAILYRFSAVIERAVFLVIPDEYMIQMELIGFEALWSQTEDGMDSVGSHKFASGTDEFKEVLEYIAGAELLDAMNSGNFYSDFRFIGASGDTGYDFKFYDELILRDPDGEIFQVFLSDEDFSALKEYIEALRANTTFTETP